MSVIVFMGPSLAVEDARALLDAVYLPPVCQGDVLRAAQQKPWGIAIIDGYFERVPAVWHKEILWAMSQGVHVFGASSMGALRAAELSEFGMVGVGEIYTGFQSGELIDDDEVTIIHADLESGYRSLSVAMVDIRATLARAVAENVLSEEARSRLLMLAKRTHYPQRSYARLHEDAQAAGVANDELSALRTFLQHGRVHQKRQDALLLLREIALQQARDPAPKRVSFHFEHTDVWEQVLRRSGHQVLAAHPDPLPEQDLLEELRLNPALWETLADASLARSLALEAVARDGVAPDMVALQQTVDDFRRERGLLDPQAVAAWLEEQRLDRDAFLELMQREAAVRELRRQREADVQQQLPDCLRVAGSYGALAARALAKRAVLTRYALENAELESTKFDESQLLDWYRTHTPSVSGASVDALYRRAGFPDRASFIQALVREYHYLALTRLHADTTAGEGL